MPKALVIRGGAIGDFLLTLPAVRLLRDSLPDLEIEVLGYKPVVDLAVKAGVADRVRSFDHADFAPLFMPGADIRPELEQWLAGFQLIVSYLFDPQGIFDANLKRFTRATVLHGPARIDESAGLHAARQLASPLEGLAMWLERESASLKPADPPEPPSPRSPTGTKAVALHPGSGGEHKCWPLEGWIDVGRHLIRRRVPVVLTTGEAEQERGVTAALLEAWRGLPVTHWDSLPLARLSDQLATECQAYVGHDSGISHLANACGLPGLVLFGPTDPSIWRPWQGRLRVLRAPDGDLSRLHIDDVVTHLFDLLDLPPLTVD